MVRNPLYAYGYLRSGRKPQTADFKLSDLRFKARKEDWIAIREVLIEDEYACVERMFTRNSRPRILDLGANIGTFALRIFSYYKSAHIASVEAADDTFHLLDENRKLNPAFKWNVFNNGIWSSDGPLTLIRRGISVGHRVIEGNGDDFVQGISLPSLLKQLKWDKIDLIKMDIEGGEEAVVLAATKVFCHTRYLIIEIHTDRIDPKPVISALHSSFKNHWQLNDRKSSKPLFVMTNEEINF